MNERHSTSGFETDLFYGEDSLKDQGVEQVADPGQFPFTRGFRASGYREHLWEMEMYAGFGSPEEANARYKFLLENGATGGVSIAMDLPTQIGFDSDDPMARGEVGMMGVALDDLRDIEDLFAGIDLAAAGHVFTTGNCIGPIFYSWVYAWCELNDVDPSSFRLQIQNDPIKEYVARGTQFLPIEAAVRLSTDTIVHSFRNTPNWLPISVSGSHMKQAGASPVQEAAFTIANAIAYMEDVERKGLPLSEFNPSLELHFCTDMDFFEEVAKYRAIRHVWSEIARDRFQVTPEQSAFRLHATTSGLPLTAQQPMNNIARIVLQVLAQVLGGAEATRTASWDEALGIPTEDAAKMSLRINQIIACETGVPDATDPMGGSYYIESLTQKMVKFINDEISQIDQMGGAIGAVKNGYYAAELTHGAYEEQRALEDGRRVVVGINRFQEDDVVRYPRFRINEESERQKVVKLVERRAMRDTFKLQRSLEDLADASKGDENVVPAVLSAVKSGATVGEICEVWRKVFGQYEPERVAL